MTPAENMDIAPRTGKPFTFTRIRDGAEASFFPGAGARIVFASNGTDTLTLPGLPVGMLVSGDAVKVVYNGTAVFRGTVATRVERQGRGTDRVEDVTVEGPWGMMARLVFRQDWAVRNPSGGTTTMSSSGLALNVAANGQPQTVAAQVYDIARYAAPRCGFTVADTDIVAGNQVLPPEEVRDIACADAIRRELRYFPQTVCRFDYSGSAPAFHAATPPAQPTPAAYLATVPMTARSFTRTAHPVVGVDIATEAFDLQADGRQLRSFTHDTAGETDSVDTLHVFMPLEKGYGSSSWEKLKVKTISTDDPAGYYTSITWWIKNHPALAGMTYQVGNTNGISAFGPITPAPADLPDGCVRMTDTTVGDLERFGLKAHVVRLSCPVTITTPEKEERLVLTLDYVFTNAHTHTYTRQTSSESAADETLPAGLAQAILDQRGGEVMGEEVTLRLGDAFPVLGDADVVDGQPLYLQSYEVDCYELTALLRFGRPDFLSPSDMRDLLLGFRQRAFMSTTAERDSAEPDDDDADDVGGVQPITSSSTTVSSIAKTTIKNAGAQSTGTVTMDTTGTGSAAGSAKVEVADSTGDKKIKLDTAEIPAGCTSGKLGVHKISFNDGNNNGAEYHVIVCSDVNLVFKGASGSNVVPVNVTFVPGKNGSADEVKFGVPTGTTAGTVAAGNHTHNYTNTPLTTALPQDAVLSTGAAQVGSSEEAARADHVHKLPSTVVDTVNSQTIGGAKTFSQVVDISPGPHAQCRIFPGAIYFRASPGNNEWISFYAPGDTFGTLLAQLFCNTSTGDCTLGTTENGGNVLVQTKGLEKDVTIRASGTGGKVKLFASAANDVQLGTAPSADAVGSAPLAVATVGWVDAHYVQGNNISITDGTGADVGKKVISATGVVTTNTAQTITGVKTFATGTGADAKKIVLDPSGIPNDCVDKTIGVHTLTVPRNDSNGSTDAYHILSCSNITLPECAPKSHTHPAPSASTITGTKTEDVITDISFAFDSNTHQLIATLTKKTLTVIDTAAISGTAPTVALPLWQQDVDSGSEYSESTNKFTKVVMPGVRTVETAPTATTDVFTAESHDTIYGGS